MSTFNPGVQDFTLTLTVAHQKTGSFQILATNSEPLLLFVFLFSKKMLTVVNHSYQNILAYIAVFTW